MDSYEEYSLAQVFYTSYISKGGSMNMNDYIAAEVAKNAAGEYEAIEGYLRLLNIQGMSKELADDIREIISDEMNHGEKLARWVIKLSGIQPAKD